GRGVRVLAGGQEARLHRDTGDADELRLRRQGPQDAVRHGGPIALPHRRPNGRPPDLMAGGKTKEEGNPETRKDESTKGRQRLNCLPFVLSSFRAFGIHSSTSSPTVG